MKRLISTVLTLVIIISCVVTLPPHVEAASLVAEDRAQALYEIGLFRGIGNKPDGSPDFALDAPITRNQAVIMLVRLLGKEETALSGKWNLPFVDVPERAVPYVGYAYSCGITNGISEAHFGGSRPIPVNQYLTFLLRALGYTSGVDFTVSEPWRLTNTIGLTMGDYSNNHMEFNRGLAVVLSVEALGTYIRTGECTLIEKLCREGAVDKERLKKLSNTINAEPLLVAFGSKRRETPQKLTSYTDVKGIHICHEDLVGVEYYGAKNYNGPYTRLGWGTGGKGVLLEDPSTVYVKIRISDVRTDENGVLIEEYSNFTEPIDVRVQSTPKEEQIITGFWKGLELYYPAAIPNAEDYADIAYDAVLGRLKYGTMATPAGTFINVGYFNDTQDIHVFGWVNACNSFGVYRKVGYNVLFRNGSFFNPEVIIQD